MKLATNIQHRSAWAITEKVFKVRGLGQGHIASALSGDQAYLSTVWRRG